MLSREQVQFLTLGGQGELADPERKELIQKISTLLKVKIPSVSIVVQVSNFCLWVTRETYFSHKA